MNGIFIAAGEAFRGINLETVSILDIAPTIMALYDIEIPPEVDGRVLRECIEPGVLKGMKMRVGKDTRTEKDEQTGMKQEDLDDMRKMLKSLGYL